MALRNVIVPARPEDVWAVLADGWSYSDWVIGTREILAVDDAWPAVGSSLRFRAGLGPLSVEDCTFSRFCDAPHRLELEACFHPVGTVRVSIEVIPWEKEALVIIDEHGLRGPSLLMENPVIESLLTLRNRRMVRLLSATVAERVRRGTAAAS